jgi:hypothetical protein
MLLLLLLVLLKVVKTWLKGPGRGHTLCVGQIRTSSVKVPTAGVSNVT